MGPIRDEAIVLRTHPLGETSLIVSLLTRGEGRVRLVAKGARSPKSSLARSLQSGSTLDVVFYLRGEGKLGLLKEVSVRQSSLLLAGRIECLALLLASVELVERIEARIEGLYEDVAELLEFLATHTEIDSPLPVYALELRLLARHGVAPSLESCLACGRPVEGEFIAYSVSEGSVRCDRCGGGEAAEIVMSRGARERLLRMREGGLAELGGDPPGEEELRELGIFLHRNLLYHVEGYRLPESLRLLRSYREVGGQGS